MCYYLIAPTKDFAIQYPGGVYLFKANNEKPRTMCKICSKLTIQILDRRR